MIRPWLRLIASAFALGAGALLGPLACDSDNAATAGVTHPTMIEVAPAEFLGDHPCSGEAGGVRRYVATLFDVTDEGAGGAGGDAEPDAEAMAGADGADGAPPPCGGFALPSSQPVSCLASVGFGFVVSGRRYCAEIDAYDTDQLEPRGTGTRMMVAGDPTDGEAPARDAAQVTPRWQTTCAGASAAFSSIIPARGCLPLYSEQPPTEVTTLRVDTSALLGDLTCGDQPGQIAAMSVTLELADYALGSKLDVECGGVVDYGSVPAGRIVSAYVEAFEAGSEPGTGLAFAGAKCQGLTKPDASVLAECAKLSELGTLRVDLPAALQSLGLACDASIQHVRVSVAEGDERRFPPPDCLQPFDRGFPAGLAAVTVTVVPTDGPAQSVICGNDIEPGSLVIADCRP